MKKITDPDFKYVNAAETAKPGYLLEKFKRLQPGIFDKHEGPPVITKPVDLKVIRRKM